MKIETASILSFVKNNWIIILIFCLGAFLRFYHLDFQSVWLDEICSINEANPNINWSDLEKTILVSDPHPPLYFAVLKILFSILGYTTIVARSFSAVIGCMGILAIYYLGKILIDKKLGLIAAFLLSINSFHIYYSQEVRMYSLLFLTTTVSFIFLVTFLRNKTFKNAVFYGFFTGLMIETQFFGLFVLLSQLLILLIDFLKTDKNFKISYFKKLTVSGITTILVFLPAANIFLITTKKKYATIQPTTIDTIFQIFKDFVQNSNYLLVLFSVLMGYFVIKTLITKPSNYKFKDTNLLLFLWVFVTLSIPIIRSYLVTPMIVSRYFITILAAILLLISLGIYYIKNDGLKILFLISIFGFTIYQSVFVENYYSKISKTQFRETTNYIQQNNTNNNIIVSGLGWYLSYFFDNKNLVKEIPPPIFIDMMITNKKPIADFWIFEGFGIYSKFTVKQNNFLNDKFFVTKSIQNFDCSAIHYIEKTESNFSEYKIPKNAITLSNLTNLDWIGGVAINLNMLLVDYSVENENKVRLLKELKLSNNKILKILSYNKVDNYLHLYLQENAVNLKEYLSYPKAIEIIK